MEKEIQQLEVAIIRLAQHMESGQWQGVEKEIKEILGYEKEQKKETH